MTVHVAAVLINSKVSHMIISSDLISEYCNTLRQCVCVNVYLLEVGYSADNKSDSIRC